MKKIFIKTLKIILTTLILLTTLPAFLTGFCFSKFNHYIDQEEIGNLVEKVKNTPDQSQKFVEIYSEIHENFRDNSTINHLWNGIIEKPSDCPCFTLTRRYFTNVENSIANNLFTIGTRLEKQLNQGECLNYLLSNFDFNFGNYGLNEAAEFYFCKPVSNLNQREFIGLIAMMQNPFFYNPLKNEEQFTRKTNELLQFTQPQPL